jgi:hypothetical protein
MSNKTIFITIPAYNDPSLLSTIEGAIDNALYPERLFFCIGMQYDELPDISKYMDDPRFNFIFYDVKNRPGVYWIRREMSERYNGQDYFLMIDSHMVFAKYWDARLINDYDELVLRNGNKTVISRPTMPEIGDTIVSGFVNDYPHWKYLPREDTDSIERTIIPWVSQRPWNGERYSSTLLSCSHFFFTSGEYINDVGFHEGIRSYCEEYTIAMTTFLSGWNIYFMTEHIYIGHDDENTTKSIYGVEKYTLGDGKRYQALFETDEEKQEIAKFVFLDNSKLFKVRSQRRNIDEFYELAGEDLKNARHKYISMLNIK